MKKIFFLLIWLELSMNVGRASARHVGLKADLQSGIKRAGSISLLYCCFFLSGSAMARGWGEFDYEFESEKPWVELEHKLPTYPKQENLLPFFVSAATDNLFYVDAASINMGEDGVVRYTLLVKTPQGALNVSFEGMRCATREKRIYAFGRADGHWTKARFAKWEPIRYADRNRQHHMLYDDFFCPGGLPANSPEDVVANLKRSAR